MKQMIIRSSPPEMFLGKGVLTTCSKCTGEHPYQSVISIKLQSNFIKIKLQHGCSPVHLLHIFRITFPKNTFEGLLLSNVTYSKKETEKQVNPLMYNIPKWSDAL